MNSLTKKRRRDRRLQAAEGYLELEMPDHALRELDEIPDADRLPAFQRLRGLAFQAAKKYEQALTAFARALAEKPEDLDVLMGMAWCYKRTDRLDLAISAMDDAYRAHPKVPVVLYNLACYHTLNGDKAQALSWLGRALRMETSLRKLIAAETDFDSLREDPDFQFIAGTHV